MSLENTTFCRTPYSWFPDPVFIYHCPLSFHILRIRKFRIIQTYKSYCISSEACRCECGQCVNTGAIKYPSRSVNQNQNQVHAKSWNYIYQRNQWKMRCNVQVQKRISKTSVSLFSELVTILMTCISTGNYKKVRQCLQCWRPKSTKIVHGA